MGDVVVAVMVMLMMMGVFGFHVRNCAAGPTIRLCARTAPRVYSVFMVLWVNLVLYLN